MVSSLQYMHHTDRLIADLFLRRRCTAHQATAYITVPVVNDRLIEPHLETFRVELQSVHVVTEANAIGEPPVAGLGSPVSSTVSVREVFMIHVGGTRCVTSSTDPMMKIRARITLTVECIRTCIFLF